MQKGADLTLDQSYIRLFLKLPRACVLFSQNSRIRSVAPLIFWLLILSIVWLWLQWPESCVIMTSHVRDCWYSWWGGIFFQWNRSIVQLDAENIKRSIIKWNYRTTMRIVNVATLNTHKSGDILHLDRTIFLNICMTEKKAESTWIKLSINSGGRRRIGFSKMCH